MDMDPVVILAERLRMAERCAEGMYAEQGSGAGNGRAAIVKLLQKKLEATEPTSVLGAGELIMLAADRLSPLPFTEGEQLRNIGDRFHRGERILSDLIWLRRIAETIEPDPSTESNRSEHSQAAAMIRLALKGAARPVMIFRAVPPVCSDDEIENGEPGQAAHPLAHEQAEQVLEE
jgi:hypothetical protein